MDYKIKVGGGGLDFWDCQKNNHPFWGWLCIEIYINFYIKL